MSIIANTTVISNFASIGQLDLLRRLFERLVVSAEVHEEIKAGLEEGYEFYAGIETILKPFAEQGWIELATMTGEAELRLFGSVPPKLHRGEASSIAIAKERGWLFLSDDAAARKYATELNVEISGTLGCLTLAVERQLMSLEQANIWLHRMIEQGYRSPVADLSELLSKK
ncbi:MAG: DUF3368 domain-containing protein [Chloroflexi bacterium]|nr:DUF3368 domain-containing protein [Chloroflexota bacterium]